MTAATALHSSGNPRLIKTAALCLGFRRLIKSCRQTPSSSTVSLALLGFCLLFAKLDAYAATDANSVSHRDEEMHKALELDGSNGYVALPDGIMKGRTEGTVEAWVQYGSLEGLQRFFSFGKYLKDIGCGFPWRQQRVKGASLEFFINSPRGGYQPITANTAIEVGTWYHLACVTGPQGMHLFLNGVEVSSSPHAGSFADIHPGGNLIGAWNSGYDQYQLDTFNGRIRDFRVWGVARSEGQIRDNRFSLSSGNQPDLIGHWNFDEVKEGKAKNRVTGSYDAQLMGKSRVVDVSDFGGREKPYANRVLDLDGNESYVQLPSNLFTNRTITWEGWVKWRNFTTYSRVFDFSDSPVQVALGTFNNNNSLLLQTYVAPGFDDHKQRVYRGILATNSWYHLATVIGPETVKLYLNGRLISTNLLQGYFKPSPLPPLANYLGRSVMKGGRGAAPDKELDGQMAEIRLWAGERSADQVFRSMNLSLTGKEPGLLALWNFRDGTAADATGNNKNGKLIGNARITQGEHKASADQPATISGIVTDPSGQPVKNVVVHLMHPTANKEANPAGFVDDTTTSDDTGSFSFAVFPSSVTYDVKASVDNLGARSDGHRLQSGTRLTVDLQLKSAISLAGKIKSLDGTASPHVVVQAIRNRPETNSVEQSASKSPDEMASVVSDEKGDFRFINLRPGSWDLRVNLPHGQRPSNQDLSNLLVEEQGRKTNLSLVVAPFKKGRWIHYTTGNGLIGNMVRQGALGPDGALWLLGSGGLSRHDGKENKDRSLTVASGALENAVSCLYVDSTNVAWLGNQHGVTLLDWRRQATGTNGIRHLTHVTNGLAPGGVHSIIPAIDGTIWVGTKLGFSKVRDGGIVTVTNPNLTDATSLRIGPNRTAWIGTSASSLWSYDGSDFRQYTAQDGFPETATINSVLVSPKDSSVWVSMQLVGLVHLQPTNSPRTLVLSKESHGIPENINCLAMGEDGTLWMGSDEGVASYDGTNVVRYTQGDGLISDASASVNDIIPVGDGTLWIATSDGLSRFDPISFQTFTTSDGLPNGGITSGRITPEGRLLFGGRVLVEYDGERFEPGSTPYLETRARSFEGNSITGIHLKSTNEYWLVGKNGLRRSTGTRIHPGWVEGHREGVDLASDKDGSLWLAGLFRGVSHLNQNTGGDLQSTDAISEAIERAGVALGHTTGATTTSVHSDDSGVLWLGLSNFRLNGTVTNRGAVRYDGKRFEYIPSPDGSIGDGILDIAEGPQNSVWFATSGGLRSFERGKSTMLTRVPGLAGNVPITCIFKDRTGRYLLGTEGNGVLVFNGTIWSRIGTGDGLDSDTVNSIVQDTLGHYWFGTPNGLTRYVPSNRIPASPIVTVFGESSDHGKDLAHSDVPQGRPVMLSLNTVDFKTLPANRRYRHQIIRGENRTPDDQSWSEPSADNTFEWKPESSGKWTFAVQFIDRDLNVSPAALRFFNVVPHWYQDPRIMGPSGILFLALLGWAVVARMLYFKKRREAESLRRRLQEQERRTAVELQTKNEQLQKANEAVLAASQAKSQFLANMSHELRTPLNAIIGYSEMLQEEVDDLGTPEIKPDLQKIHGAGKHLLGLINDILDLSKIEAGKMSLYLETFEIQPLLNEVAATVQPLVQKNGNQLTLEVAADIGSMRADVTKVRQTLLNLLSNASKFTDKGTILLRARRQGDSLVFDVIDSGIGMTPEQVGRLFQAFAQADSATSKKYGGTGLGLALSRKFCQLMGGDMTVVSEAGKGSTFTATIPAQVIEPSDETAAASTLIPAAIPSTGSGPLVLVIDDDTTVLDLLRRSLNRDGFRVETASDGASGLAQARALRPAIITLDVMMPGMGGWEVLAALKEDPATSDIPVVVMSIVDEKGLGFSLGAADYLTKPLDFNRLAMVLKRHAKAEGEHTVLVVEDEPATQELVSKQLERNGWRVILAGNGREALDRVSESKPDLVLLDLMMPEMDGFEFLEEFRKQPGCAQTTVVVMTAKILTPADHQRLRGQVAQVVAKANLSPEMLAAEIRLALGKTPSPRPSTTDPLSDF